MNIDNVLRGVVYFGGQRHLVDIDASITRFFCGRSGVATPGANHKRVNCRGCISEAQRLQFEGA
jgi:hypothetical protein